MGTAGPYRDWRGRGRWGQQDRIGTRGRGRWGQQDRIGTGEGVGGGDSRTV